MPRELGVRACLGLLTAATATAVLGACSNLPLSQLASDANLIATGISSAVASIKLIPGLPTAAVTQIEGYLATIQKDAAAIAAATTAPATGNVQEIAQAVQAIASVVLPLGAAVPGLAPFVPLIEAAISLLPAILAAVGVSGGELTGQRYTPAEARLILSAWGV